MKSIYSLLILSIIALFSQCNDNNETKKFAIVEVFNALVAQPKLNKAERTERSALKKELSHLSNQDYLSESDREQITKALKEDTFKTPENSPVKLYPAIVKKQPVQTAADLANKENLPARFNTIVRYINFGSQQTAPNTVQLDMIYNKKKIALNDISNKQNKK